MKHFVLLILLGVLFSCFSKNSRQKESKYYHWESEYPLDTAVVFQGVSNATHGFSYIYPMTFQTQLDTMNVIPDSTVYRSENGEVKLKLFIQGGVLRREDRYSQEQRDKEYEALIERGNQIQNGSHELSKNINFTQSTFPNPLHIDRSRIQFIGENRKMEIMWVIELSEIPINGDLSFKNMYFEYPKEQREFYHPIGIEMVNKFGFLK